MSNDKQIDRQKLKDWRNRQVSWFLACGDFPIAHRILSDLQNAIESGELDVEENGDG